MLTVVTADVNGADTSHDSKVGKADSGTHAPCTLRARPSTPAMYSIVAWDCSHCCVPSSKLSLLFDVYIRQHP